MVAGYAQGTYLQDQGIYRVYTNDSHTWVEAFFPGYGWVEFEPTAAEAPIERSARASERQPGGPDRERDMMDDPWGEEEMMLDRGPILGEIDDGAGLRPGQIGWIAGTLAAAVLLVIGAAAVIRSQSRVTGPSLTIQAYDRMNRFARWLGVQLLPSQTPHERAAVLVTAAPEAQPPIDVITDLYVEERFGQVENGRYDERAANAWRELWPSLAKHGALHALSRVQLPHRRRKLRWER